MTRKIITTTLTLFACLLIKAQIGQQNYVKTTSYIDGQGTAAITGIQFYDGLGRPSVSGTNATDSAGKFAYSLTSYDMNGRKYEEWLPAADGITLAFPASMNSLSQATYSDSHAYTVIGYDGLDRVTSITKPGDAWHTNSKQLAVGYGYNGNGEVRRYKAWGQQDGLTDDGYHASGALRKEVATDEDLRTTTVFRDIMGNVVLERQDYSPDPLDTYYVYNEYGQLRYVLQPMFQQDDDLDAYAFQYAYNAKGLCSMKKIPGCEPVCYWYDSHTNRMAFMQNGNMRSSGRYRFMLYDSYGRLAVQGLCTLTEVPGSIHARADYTNTADGVAHTGYVMSSNVSLVGVTLEKACYYDDYNFLNKVQDQTVRDSLTATGQSRKPGLQTGEAVLSADGEMLFTAIYYDGKGRETDRRRMMPGGDFLRNSATYTFTDKPATVTEHLTHGGNTQNVAYTYSYYPANNQPSEATLSYNGRQPVSIARYGYDGLGRVTQLKRGGEASVVGYTYHIQGGPKSVQGSAFSQWLLYEESLNGARYSGDISGMQWNYAGTQGTYDYMFSYDGAGRLTNASFDMRYNTLNLDFDEHISYDANGNVLTMTRHGIRDNSECGTTDSLLYTYSGNQLVKVRDCVTGPNNSSTFHFTDNANEDVEYEYDQNGNMTKNLNKKISLIEYNSLNLPSKIQMGASKIKYHYTSGGEKTKSWYPARIFWLLVGEFGPINSAISPDGGGTAGIMSPRVQPGGSLPEIGNDSLEYRGSFIYHNGSLELVLFDGGYISFSAQGVPQFHYYERDYLGSVRAIVGETGAVEHTNSYYPFGAQFFKNTQNFTQRYKFCGKELDSMHGINLLDFGARWYDPLLGRFTTIDPMCEKYYSVSPYAYCMNNPVNAVDLEGKLIYYLTIQNDGTQKPYLYQQQNGTYGFYNNNSQAEDLYSRKLLSALNSIRQGAVGNSLVSFLENSDRNIYIRSTIEDKKEGSMTYDNKYNHNIVVAWDSDNYSFAQNEYGVKDTPTFVSLAHELFHSKNMVLGASDYSNWIMYNGKPISMEERSASLFENIIRTEHGLLQRTNYIDYFAPSAIPFQSSNYYMLQNHYMTLWRDSYYPF